jgi:predicted transcriptional regulator
MVRKSSQLIVNKIILSLKNGKKTVYEIAKDVGTNWASIKKYLETLSESGMILQSEENGKRIFCFNEFPRTVRDDTYFGLPLAKDVENKIDSLFGLIKKEWKKETDIYPGKTQMQKCFVRVNTLCNLNLPMGWYLFGEIAEKIYEPDVEYAISEFIEDEKVNLCVCETVKKYSGERSVYELRLSQYSEFNNELYQTKELLGALLINAKKENIMEISKQLYAFMKFLPSDSLSDIPEIASDFVGTALSAFSLPEQQIQELKAPLFEAFNSLWQLIAVSNYWTDMKKWHNQETLKDCIQYELNMARLDAIQNISYLCELIPSSNMPKDEDYLRLKSLLGSGRELSLEEKKARAEKIEKIRKEKGEEGVQEFVTKEFGL